MIKFLYLIIIVSCFISCANLKNISVEDIEPAIVRKQSGSKMIIESKIKINNPTCHKLVLRKINAEILRNGYQFADVRLKEKVKIPAHSNDYHSVLIELNIIDVMAVITKVVDIIHLDDSFTTTGFIKGSAGIFCKKIKFNDILVNQLNTSPDK